MNRAPKIISQKGASLVEYSLLVSLVAGIVITGVQTTGQETKCQYHDISVALGDNNGTKSICSSIGLEDAGIPANGKGGTGGQVPPGAYE